MSLEELPLGTSREDAHARAEALGANCAQCPLRGAGRGPVLGQLTPGAKLHAIGEAPGDNEVEVGRVFAGATGRILRSALREGGLADSEVALSNALLCQPWDATKQIKMGLGDYVDRIARLNRKAYRRWEQRRDAAAAAGVAFLEDPPLELRTPLECCAPRLQRDIATVGAKTLLAVGAAALKQTAIVEGVPYGKAKVEPGKPRVLALKDQQGHPVTLADGRVLMSTYHPAYAMHSNRAMGRVIRDAIVKAARVAAAQGTFEFDPPPFYIRPSLSQVLNFIAACKQQRRGFVDLETTGLRWWRRDCYILCIGLGAVIDGREEIMVIPVRHQPQPGAPADVVPTPYWEPHEIQAIGLALRDYLDDPNIEIVGHNVIGFDSGKMLAAGIMTDRSKLLSDTAVMHHDTWANDLAHDLGFTTGYYLNIPNWKKDADAKYIDGVVGDDELWRYNGLDVWVLMRLYAPLWKDVLASETVKQYEVDKQIQNICRNMTELGITPRESIRQEMSQKLNLRCNELLADLQHIACGYLPQSAIEDKLAGPDDDRHWEKRPQWAAFNPRSVNQLRDLLFDDFDLEPPLSTKGLPWDEEDDSEDPSTSAAALVKILDKGVGTQAQVLISRLLEYRAYDKLRGTYVDNLNVEREDWTRWGLPASMNGEYMLVHPTWIGWRVPTGRLACRNPNAMNLPSRGRMNMYNMYYAPEGHVYVGADKDQLELRLYAAASGDELVWKAIRDGLDPHALNAATMWAQSEKEVQSWYDSIVADKDAHCSNCTSRDEPCKTCAGRHKEAKKLRNIAKRFVFLELYGGGFQTLFDTMCSDRNPGNGKLMFPGLAQQSGRVKTWHENWHKYHPWTRQWHQSCYAFEREHGFINTMFYDFRKRYGPFDDIVAIPNMKIQGSAGSMMNQHMLELDEAVPFRGWSKVSGIDRQVHDYLGIVVPESRADEAKKIVEQIMNITINGMPYTAESKASRCWAHQ